MMGTASQLRHRQLDEIAEALPRRASALTRLFLTRSGPAISRTEIAVLRMVTDRPQRIGDLAAAEGVTQPAISLVVNRLQARGWVTREHDPADGRAVLVRLTAAGRDQLERVRADYRALLHEEMATLPDDDVETLARAIEILDGLIARLRGGAAT
jgi:DNA-binding MarR family transcriptional regulator